MISERTKAEFEYLIEMAQRGNLVLVETTFRATGKPAYAICVHEQLHDRVDIWPIGVLARDDVGFELMNAPEGAEERMAVNGHAVNAVNADGFDMDAILAARVPE